MAAKQDMDQRLLDEGEARAAALLRQCEGERAEFGDRRQLVLHSAAQSGDREFCAQHRGGRAEDLALVVAVIEVARHFRHSRGRPRMRSAMMLRWISAVPPAIVSL